MFQRFLMLARAASYLWPRLFRRRYGHILRGADLVKFSWVDLVQFRRQEWPPFSVLQSDPLLPGAREAHSFQRRETLLLKNATLDPVSGTVALNGVGVAESTPWNPEKRFYLSFRLAWPLRTDGRQHFAFLVSTSWNYYHFLIEDLPAALRVLENADAMLLVGKGAPTYVHEALDLLGISSERIGGVRRVPNLWLATRGNDTGWPHPQDLKVLRSHLGCGDENVEADTRIYVSRRYSRRSLPYEDLIEDWLKTLGFLIVYAETMGFEEQVRLFGRSSVVVGPHGAGLANTVFCSPKARLIELSVEDFVNVCFEVLAEELGLGFSRVFLPPVSFSEARRRIEEVLGDSQV